MESSGITIGARAQVIKAGKKELFGHKLRQSLMGKDLRNMFCRNLKFDQSKCLKVNKPGVAFSVLTSDFDQKILKLEQGLFDSSKVDPKKVAALILCGGAGTRLHPLTLSRSKPAVPLGGCYRLIDIPMSNCINSGIIKIFILTQYNSFSLNRHVSKTYNLGEGVNFGDGFVEILAATQKPGENGQSWFRGTADAVRQFSWVFEDNRYKGIEHLLILSGDHLYRMDYLDFLRKHIDTKADISVSCVPMDDSRASDFGLMKIDGTRRIVHFAEKPEGSDLKAMEVDTSLLGLSDQEAVLNPYIASMGVYLFRRDVLMELLNCKYPERNDFGSEIIPSAIAEYNVQAYLFNGYWEDIGTIKSFFNANLALTDEFPKFEFYDPQTPFYTSARFLPPTKADKCKIVRSIVSHGCFLHECHITRSIVGIRSRLGRGVVLENTLMMGADNYQTEEEIDNLLKMGEVPIGVGENTKIRNCIIDKNAKIGKNVIIANHDGVKEADQPNKGFYIRSGIVVIPKSATIKDGVVI